MSAAAEQSHEVARRRRTRRPGLVKHCRIAIAVDEGERRELEAAAQEDGLTVSAFVADQALAAARHTPPGSAGTLREYLRALNHATAQLRRAGINLNQAVATLNATGQPPGNLHQYARYTADLAQQISDAADRVQQALP